MRLGRTCFLPKLNGQKDHSVACPICNLRETSKVKSHLILFEQDLKTIQKKLTDVVRPLLLLWSFSPDAEGNWKLFEAEGR